MVGVTKAVSDRFGKGGIADRMIWFNGFPFLDNKEDHTFNVPVSTVATPSRSLKCLPVTGLTINDIHKLLAETLYSGFPIVEDATSMELIGYIGRTELRYALDRAKRDQHVPNTARCSFDPLDDSHAGASRHPSMTPSTPGPAVFFDDAAESAQQIMTLDLSKFIDATPISVHPHLPLETTMELFKKLGPRVILVEGSGKLFGLVTVKDCLKYQFQVEAQENPRDDRGVRDRQEVLWGAMQRVVGFVGKQIGWKKLGRTGHVRLNSAESFRLDSSEGLATGLESSQSRRASRSTGDGVELEDR